MQPIPRFTTSYKSIPAGGGAAGSTLLMDMVSELEGCLIVGFQTYDDSIATADPNRIPLLPTAESVSVMITLHDGSDERFKDMPWIDLMSSLQAGVVRECDPFRMNWQASSYRFTGTVTPDRSLMMGWWYIRPEDCASDADRDLLFPGWRRAT